MSATGTHGTHQRIGQVTLVPTTSSDAIAGLIDLALAGNPARRHVHLINAYSVCLADRDPCYRQALEGTALNLADGKPLSWISRWLRHTPPLRQIRGPKLFPDVIDAGRQFNVKHYLLGATTGVLDQLQAEIQDRFPGALIVGTEAPPFREQTPDELAKQDERIAASGAHIVWVGLGTPKQDYEVKRLADRVGALPIGVGAAFDFTAGTKCEAPVALQKLGLEWFFRLVTEPRRLWKRYLIGNVLFLHAALRRQGP